MRKILLAFFLGTISTGAQAACTVPWTFSNLTTADATQVNANFTAVLGCIASFPVPPPTRVLFIKVAQSPYTLTVATGETRARVRAWGPGGSGGGAQSGSSGSGCGGGAGGYFDDYITGLAAPQTVTVTVGAGGVGAATTVNGNNGSAATTFGTYASAGQGAGGNAGPSCGSLAGGYGTATINTGTGMTVTGQQGGTYNPLSNGTVTIPVGGAGGAAAFSGSTPYNYTSTAAAYPGGGSAASASSSNSSAAGADGLVIIELYP